MIIDIHCHAGTGDGLRGPWDTEARIEPHLARAAAAGIDLTCVFPVFNRDYAAANARLARIVRRHERQLIGFAAVHPRSDAGRVDRLVGTAVERYGFRGIKVHGFDAFPTREVCEVAERHGIPLLVDIVGRINVLEMLAWQYPGVSFIVPHLGGFKDDWAVHLALIDRMRRYPNVFGDTSGVRYWDALPLALREAGPHKLLFGSDGPQLHPGVELHKIRVLQAPAGWKRAIMGGNAARLLGMSVCAPHSPACRDETMSARRSL